MAIIRILEEYELKSRKDAAIIFGCPPPNICLSRDSFGDGLFRGAVSLGWWLVTQNQIGRLPRGLLLRDSMVRAVGRVRPRSRLSHSRTRNTKPEFRQQITFFPVHRFIRSDRISSNAHGTSCKVAGKFHSSNPAWPPGVLQGRCTCMHTTTVISCVHPAGCRHCL
jgi:hypothetical protein